MVLTWNIAESELENIHSFGCFTCCNVMDNGTTNNK